MIDAAGFLNRPLEISNKSNNPVQASVFASMLNASLDQKKKTKKRDDANEFQGSKHAVNCASDATKPECVDPTEDQLIQKLSARLTQLAIKEIKNTKDP